MKELKKPIINDNEFEHFVLEGMCRENSCGCTCYQLPSYDCPSDGGASINNASNASVAEYEDLLF